VGQLARGSAVQRVPRQDETAARLVTEEPGGPMDTQEREVFAKEWLRGWNERDLTQILSHYGEDVEFQSPVAA
jgi:hypothetical protein